MDQRAPTASDTQNQTPADQPVSVAQQPTTTQPAQQTDSVQPQTPPQQKAQISVGNVEEGAASIIQESSDAGAEDDEDEIMVAPQETKNQAISQGGGVDAQEEAVAMHPSGTEAGVSVGAEVEPFVEKTPDQEKPELPQEVQDAGVTHSGPGVILVEENTFGVTQMPPITKQQADAEIKKTPFKSSKHWLMGLLEYIWSKIEKTKEKKEQELPVVMTEAQQNSSTMETNTGEDTVSNV